jgi:osmotically-inducible protein OsmY
MSVSKKENRMKNFFLLVPLLFGLNMVLVGCDQSNQPTSQTSSSPSASKMSDSDLEQAIRAKFDSDAQLKEAKLDVDADVDKNEVTISGTVRSQEARSKAVELAKGVQSGLTVNDKIDVKPAA